MAIFVIGDLHLSFQENKPMSIFGVNWENHEEKIRKDWMQKVTQNDLVVLPGDFSWAMHLKDTKKDFAASPTAQSGKSRKISSSAQRAQNSGFCLELPQITQTIIALSAILTMTATKV